MLLLLCSSSLVNAQDECAECGPLPEDLTSQTGYVWDPADEQTTGNLVVIENFQNWTLDESVEPTWGPTDVNGNGIFGEYLGTMYIGDSMEDCYANAIPGVPCYNMNTDTAADPVLRMSWGHGSVYQTFTIASELQNLGYDVVGLQYSWEINNAWNDEAYATVTVRDINGNAVYYSFYNYNYMATNGWLNETTTAYLPDAYPVENIAYGMLDWHGTDAQQNVDAYYGPRWRNGSFEFIYVFNPCYVSVLSDPSCNGYAEAYAEQQYTIQCTANPLYDSGCPGYDDAYLNFMCTSNPTYSLLCPNYPVPQDVYADQQIVDIVSAEVEQEIIASVEAEAEDNHNFEFASTINTVDTEEAEIAKEQTEEERKEEQEKKKAKDEKIKKIIIARLATLTSDLETASIEEAKRIQEQMLALMNFVPGFKGYNIGLPDGVLYASENPYEKLYVPDSRQGLRNGLAQEIKHKEMVLSQYN